ncbi:unnamed protein product [Nippostrongylus brasiliensis]|uniref:Aminotran_5 domain-containing protein n=1 Tax=Nippostrongylus brasiliensis TaxID=27835 RepID=A0A0N4XIX2_NIPBR|nr:unnamed protein product [Nippostrongylus brasiliensis]
MRQPALRGLINASPAPSLSITTCPRSPILSVSASGTERTVEGVANAALRVLLLKEAAGDAMNAMLQEKFDRTCDVLNVKHPDRRVMIADGTTQAPQIVLAMTQAYGEYNYATGY